MEGIEIAPVQCPVCKHKLDRTGHPGERSRPPQKGDLMICVYCGAAMQFDEGLRAVAVSAEELAEFGRKWPDVYDEMKKCNT